LEQPSEGKVKRLLALARYLARKHSDKDLEKAAEILLHLIDNGCANPEVYIDAATYLLQGPKTSHPETRQKAISLIDQSVALAPDNLAILESAIRCYELILGDFPEKQNEIIQLSLKILDVDLIMLKP
jgi:hypothetical protein